MAAEIIKGWVCQIGLGEWHSPLWEVSSWMIIIGKFITELSVPSKAEIESLKNTTKQKWGLFICFCSFSYSVSTYFFILGNKGWSLLHLLHAGVCVTEKEKKMKSVSSSHSVNFLDHIIYIYILGSRNEAVGKCLNVKDSRGVSNIRGTTTEFSTIRQ